MPTNTKKCKACLSDIPVSASRCYKCSASQGLSSCMIVLIVFVVIFFALPMLAGFLMSMFSYRNILERANELEQIDETSTQNTFVEEEEY